jgi:hypothetical protein
MVQSGVAMMLRSCLACASVAAMMFAQLAPANADGPPAEVRATYRISYLGVDIGTFQFSSTSSGNSYSLNGSAQLSLLLGALKWSGSSSARGQIVGTAVRPATYSYDFKSNKKTGRVQLALANNNVTNVVVEPPSHPGPQHVPLSDQHLKQVLDPLSAVLALSQGSANGSNPCGRRLAIFDGKQRFDLQFSYRGQQPVAEKSPSGQPGTAYVCNVRYLPIAGHRMHDENKQFADNAKVEVAMRPIPSANLFVPYKVTIPTIAGTATMTAQRVEIITASRAQIALSH